MAAIAGGADAEPAGLAVGELADIFLDPYVNAIHVTLLRENNLNPEYANGLTQLGVGSPDVRLLGEKLLVQGIEALNPSEMMLLICDADVMSRLHREVWLRSKDHIARSWQTAIRRYSSQP
jgi:membrane glycosyltransferase